jgi:DUF917 family protein
MIFTKEHAEYLSLGSLLLGCGGGGNVQQATNSSPFEDLKNLAELRDRGILTEVEYAKLKADCLARIK